MKLVAKVLLVMILSISSVMAQESATTELDACVKNKQLLYGGVGTVAGAAVGAGIAYFTRSNIAQGMAIGSAVGGLAGFGISYFKAYGMCMEEHPEWKKESQLTRTKDFYAAKRRYAHSRSSGDLIKIEKLRLKKRAALGSNNPISAKIVMLSLDGAEREVVFTNRIFIIQKDKTGRPQMISHVFHGAGEEKRVIESGEFVYENEIPLPAMLPDTKEMVGKILFYELEVSVNNSIKDRKSFEFEITKGRS